MLSYIMFCVYNIGADREFDGGLLKHNNDFISLYLNINIIVLLLFP